jgi:hypothetical protein
MGTGAGAQVDFLFFDHRAFKGLRSQLFVNPVDIAIQVLNP